MKDCIRYSPRASLALVGMNIRQMGIWEMIGQRVKIQQKTVIHTPLQKLQDAAERLPRRPPGTGQ